MRPSANLLMGLAETLACLWLATSCVALAMDGDHLAWAVGFGSLSFAWNAWRRFSRTRHEQTPRTPEGGTSPGG
ncbi:hypothetical protein [Streptomyces sp. NPDC047024]|uniref:hypothetical protein n=1 Tax=Streptomyces sp. NPDC047024 TaxID=3155476 RepID=UPI0033C1A2C3